MLPVALLIALMVMTWAAAVVSVYVESDHPTSPSDRHAEEQDYSDAA